MISKDDELGELPAQTKTNIGCHLSWTANELPLAPPQNSKLKSGCIKYGITLLWIWHLYRRGISVRFLNWLLDCRWLGPFIALIILLSSIFVTNDFEGLQKKYPDWSGFYGLAGTILLFVLCIAAVIQLLLIVGKNFREPTMSELKHSIQDAETRIGEIGSVIRQLFDGMLFTFAKRIQLTHDDHVRISIYIHDADRKIFVPCGRYSPSPNLARPGRTYYADNEGCIGKGWDHGWYFDNDFPEETSQRRKYEKDNYGLSRTIVDGFTMHSRLYAVKRINEGNGQALAVIVVEAISPNRFEQANLQAALDDENDSFASMILNLRDYIPNPSSAEESGL